jgi:hypothetical protein
LNESVDRRALGAFRCVDSVTGTAILDALAATSDSLVLKPNRSRLYVIFNGPGFSPLTAQFLPAAATWPPPASFEVLVRDPQGRYLPRRATVQVPQKLAPASDPASVFNPQTVTMFRSSSAPVLPNWAVMRVSVARSGTDPAQGLPWSIVRVTRTSDNTVLATGMGDARGEALLAVRGIGVQVSGNGGGAVVASTVDVSVDVWFDPGVLEQPAGWVPNPDEVLSNLAAPQLKHAAQAAKLGAGMSLALGFSISL